MVGRRCGRPSSGRRTGRSGSSTSGRCTVPRPGWRGANARISLVMRVLMLSWEYPPVVIGGLGRHVHALAKHLAGQGHEVVVLCRHEAGTDALTHPTQRSLHEGVRLVRVAEDPTHLTFEKDLVAWTLEMGHAMIRAGLALLRSWHPDVVHAHDWLVTHPAIALAEYAGVPLVATMHATEAGRHS